MSANILATIRNSTILFGWLTLAQITSSAQATIIFSDAQTGLELFNNSDVTFPSVSPVINGSSIDFSSGTEGEALLVWDLLPAESRGDLEISIAIDYTPLTLDNDPFFAIFDGSNFIALQRADNMNGEILIRSGLATNTTLLGIPSDSIPLTGIGSVEPFSYELWVVDGGAGPASVNNFVEGVDSATGPFFYPSNFIDTDNPLSFVVYRPEGSAASEQYRINSIAIDIEEKETETVPEPKTILGSIIGLGLGLRRRRNSGQHKRSQSAAPIS